jgi:hypothetical protein
MTESDEEARDVLAATRAAAAVALISQELSRRNRNWNALRVLSGRLLEICDQMDRGLELDPDR